VKRTQRLHAAEQRSWLGNTTQDLPGEDGDSATGLTASPPTGQAVA
jgi:hypothetical protein